MPALGTSQAAYRARKALRERVTRGAVDEDESAIGTSTSDMRFGDYAAIALGACLFVVLVAFVARHCKQVNGRTSFGRTSVERSFGKDQDPPPNPILKPGGSGSELQLGGGLRTNKI